MFLLILILINIAEDTTLVINAVDPQLCSQQYVDPDENKQVYFAVQKTKSSFYKCKCLPRDLSLIMGSIDSSRSKSPLTSTVCSDELMAPKLDLVNQQTSLLKFLKESNKELQNTLTDDNSTLINICNPTRAINIVTLYLSHFLGLNVDNIITNYVYNPRQTFVYPGNVSNSPTPVAAVPNLQQAFWTIVSQV